MELKNWKNFKGFGTCGKRERIWKRGKPEKFQKKPPEKGIQNPGNLFPVTHSLENFQF